MKKFYLVVIVAILGVVFLGIRAQRSETKALTDVIAKSEAKKKADAQVRNDVKAQTENDRIIRARKAEADKAEAILAEKKKVVNAKAESWIVMDQILDTYGYQDLKAKFHKDLAETDLFDLASVPVVKKLQKDLQGLDGDEAAKLINRAYDLCFGFYVKHELAKRLEAKALLARQKPVWEAREAEMVKTPPARHLPHVQGRLAFSPDSTLLATLAYAKLTIWNLQAEKQVFQKDNEGHNGALAFSPDGKYLAVGAHDGVLRVYEVPSGKLAYQPIQKIGRTLDVTYVKWFGNHLVAAGMKDDIVVVRWPEKKELLRWNPLAYGPRILDLKVKKDEVEELLIHASHCCAMAYPSKKGTDQELVRVDETVLDYDPSSQVSLLSKEAQLAVRKNGKVTTFKPDRRSWHENLAPNAQFIVSWDMWDARVYLYDLQGRKVLKVRYGHDLGVRYGERSGDSVGSAIVSPDGKVLAVTGSAGLKIWTIPVQK